jgi:hypothetical protein
MNQQEIIKYILSEADFLDSPSGSSVDCAIGRHLKDLVERLQKLIDDGNQNNVEAPL